MKQCLSVFILCLCIAALGETPKIEGNESVRRFYARALEELAVKYRKTVDAKKRRVMVGDFPCANVGQEGVTTMSRVIHDRLAEACSDNSQFRLIGRDHLEKLLMERKLQSSDLVDPKTITEIKVEGVDGLIHGSYVYAKPKIMLTLNLTMLDGAGKITITSEIPVSLLGSNDILPPGKQTPAVVETFLQPTNRARQKVNLARVRKRLAALPTTEIRADVWVEGARNHFVGGETIRYILRVDREAFVALLCHQLNGEIVQLFPNRHNRDNRLRADVPLTVPGDRTGFQIRVGPPYGGDVVQIIACSDKTALEKLVRAWVSGKGSAVPARDKAIWGEQHILVNTHPRP